METHNYTRKDQIGARDIGLILCGKLESMERVHERYLKKLRRRQDAFLALKAYVPRAQALLRGMAEVVDMLLAEDVKDVVDSLFQSRRWKVLNSYIVARGVFVLYRLRLATSRGRYPSSRSARGGPMPVPSGYGPENNWTRDDSPEEMQRKAKIHRELWELDRSRDLFLQHQSKRRQVLQRPPWGKAHGDPTHLKTNIHHRRRHRLWRKCTPRAVWLGRRETKWVAADQ